jgi:DNA-binding SARP family transcriptional activator/tetratricopeptide (TPR) repeat protein
VQLGLLGPLVLADRTGRHVPVAGPRLRVLLAALALQANTPVSTDMLAEAVWDGVPPPAAARTLRSHVARLRRLLGPEAGRVESCEPGYLIRVDPGDLDVARFEALCREAGAAVRAGEWARTADTAARALELWRGTPLADIPSRLIRDQWVPRLEQLHVQALEWRIEGDLHEGRHEQVIGELGELTARHPLRERFHGQLMLALYGCGRQGEALAAYQAARDVLIAELGVEPGHGLRDLHQQVLSGDPALTVTRPARPVATEAERAVPRELPPTIPDFTGRSAELTALTRLADRPGGQARGAVVITAVGGMAGIGKTALAVHWAHQVAGRFGDGQLYVNLRGFDPSGTPATPAEAVRGFLDALWVPPERIPRTLDAQAALYRSLLAGKRMLIVLDNARDEAQVRPLLPASAGSLVIVTSRNQLSGLAAADGARLLNLDVLAHGEAVQLLTARIGAARAAADPEAAGEIARLCAHLPLALAVAAARAAARPRFSLAELAAELSDAAGRLDALDAGDPAASVAAVFSWSYRQLGSQAARMFRLLGLHPGPDISVPAAASLAGTDPPEARRLLRELARDCLITEHLPGRYAFHDLLRAYAASQSRDIDTRRDRGAATSRVLDHYLHTADRGSMLLHQSREPLALAPPERGAVPCHLADHRQALAWFEAEHQALLAVVALAAETGMDSHAWQLPCVMTSYLHRRGYLHEGITVMGTALTAAMRLDDALGQAMALRRLGNVYANTGDHDLARAHLQRCLLLYQRLGDHHGEALAQQCLAVLAEAQGRYADGLAHSERALRLFRAAGHEAAEAEVLNCVGWFLALLGDYQRARAFCEKSLALIAKLDGCPFEHLAWDSLGYVELHLGNVARAAGHFEVALRLCRDHGDRYFEAEILIHIGDTRHAIGELPQARQAWQQALAIYDNIQHPDASKVRAKLTSTNS